MYANAVGGAQRSRAIDYLIGANMQRRGFARSTHKSSPHRVDNELSGRETSAFDRPRASHRDRVGVPDGIQNLSAISQ